MDKIPTAQEFLLSKSWNTSHAEIKLMTLALIEFAQLHSESALKAATKNVYIRKRELREGKTVDISHTFYTDNGKVAHELMVEPSSILNAYPKELIK